MIASASPIYEERLLVRSLTRHELKEQLQHDQFTDAVSGAVQYASSHRQNLIRYGIAAVAVALIAGGIWWYMSSQADLRRGELDSTLGILDAQVTTTPNPDSSIKTYPTEDAKQAAFLKALDSFIAKYNGSSEGYVAQYYRGTERAAKDDLAGAESDLHAAADSGNDISSVAKIALANVYLAEKKNVEAQTLLQALAKDSSPLVSKAQAQILQAQVSGANNPQAARDILKNIDPADKKREAVLHAADTVSSEFSK